MHRQSVKFFSKYTDTGSVFPYQGVFKLWHLSETQNSYFLSTSIKVYTYKESLNYQLVDQNGIGLPIPQIRMRKYINVFHTLLM